MKVSQLYVTVLKLHTAKSSPKVPPSKILLIALKVVSGQQAMTGGLGPTSRFHVGDPWWTESLNKVYRLYATVLKMVTTKSSLKECLISVRFEVGKSGEVESGGTWSEW